MRLVHNLYIGPSGIEMIEYSDQFDHVYKVEYRLRSSIGLDILFDQQDKHWTYLDDKWKQLKKKES
jgi:hypothetical protein